MAGNDKTPLEQLKEAGKDIKDPVFQYYLQNNDIEAAQARFEQVRQEHINHLNQQVSLHRTLEHSYLGQNGESKTSFSQPTDVIINSDPQVSGLRSEAQVHQAVKAINVHNLASFDKALEGFSKDINTLSQNIDGMRSTLPEQEKLYQAAKSAGSHTYSGTPLEQAAAYYKQQSIDYAKANLNPADQSDEAALTAYNDLMRDLFHDLAGEVGYTVNGVPLAELDDLASMPPQMQTVLQTDPKYAPLRNDKQIQNRLQIEVKNTKDGFSVVPAPKAQDLSSVGQQIEFERDIPAKDIFAFGVKTEQSLHRADNKLNDLQVLQGHLLHAKELAAAGNTAEAQAYLDVVQERTQKYKEIYQTSVELSPRVDGSAPALFSDRLEEKAARAGQTQFMENKRIPSMKQDFINGPTEDILDRNGNVLDPYDYRTYKKPGITKKRRPAGQAGGIAGFDAALKEHGEAAKAEAAALKEEALAKAEAAAEQAAQVEITEPTPAIESPVAEEALVQKDPIKLDPIQPQQIQTESSAPLKPGTVKVAPTSQLESESKKLEAAVAAAQAKQEKEAQAQQTAETPEPVEQKPEAPVDNVPPTEEKEDANNNAGFIAQVAQTKTEPVKSEDKKPKKKKKKKPFDKIVNSDDVSIVQANLSVGTSNRSLANMSNGEAIGDSNTQESFDQTTPGSDVSNRRETQINVALTTPSYHLSDKTSIFAQAAFGFTMSSGFYGANQGTLGLGVVSTIPKKGIAFGGTVNTGKGLENYEFTGNSGTNSFMLDETRLKTVGATGFYNQGHLAINVGATYNMRRDGDVFGLGQTSIGNNMTAFGRVGYDIGPALRGDSRGYQHARQGAVIKPFFEASLSTGYTYNPAQAAQYNNFSVDQVTVAPSTQFKVGISLEM